MSSYSIGYMVGCMAGVIIGIILIAFLFKFTRKDGSVKCKYDERQQLIRGRGFKYGFFTMIVCEALVILFGGILEMFVERNIISFFGICLGVVVYASYSLWNDGYIALNENPKRLMIVFAVLSLMNIVIGISNILNGTLIENGIVSYRAVNLICGVMVLIIFIEMIIKYTSGKDSEERQ